MISCRSGSRGGAAVAAAPPFKIDVCGTLAMFFLFLQNFKENESAVHYSDICSDCILLLKRLEKENNLDI